MTINPRIEYHLNELRIARDPGSHNHAMPLLREDDRAVLDIGCGIGQTLVALDDHSGRLLVGVDVDTLAIGYGRGKFSNVGFANAAAEDLPFGAETFDLVISRVTLPYTDLSKSLAEIARVLKANGRLWATLHPPSMPLRELVRGLMRFRPKTVASRAYVLLNGTLLHVCGRQVASPWSGRYESFQTRRSIRYALGAAGFHRIAMTMGGVFEVKAHKRSLP